jgi:hypothetical protein
VSDPIKLFVGADGTNCDLESQVVLEYSVRKHASQPVEIVWMQQSADGPYSGWKCGTGRTPFSHFRWSIPAMCGYAGKGIYCDSDFIFLADIAELWRQDVPGVFLSKQPKKHLGKTCCLLFNCAHAKGHVPDLKALRKMPDPQGTLTKYFKEHPELSSGFEGNWNALDGDGMPVGDPRMKAIHYTRMEHQFHLKYARERLAKEGRAHWYAGPTFAHPRADLQALFDALYAEALSAGYTVGQYGVDAFAGSTRRNFTYTHHQGTA